MRSTTLSILLAAAFGAQLPLAVASDKAATVIPAEGNKQCSDYASNALVLQMGTNAPLATGLLSGPENPRDSDTVGESALYTVSAGTTAGFASATTPVDFAILKSGRSVSVLIYPAGGVRDDANMKLMVGGQPLPITAISLCYGLGNAAPPPPVASTIKSCNLDASLDQTGVACPASGRTLVCNFELDTPFYGLNNGSDSCCVCNTGGELQECDPGVAAGEPNACPLATTKAGTEVTTHVELNNDPYVCTTVAGLRKCYAY